MIDWMRGHWILINCTIYMVFCYVILCLSCYIMGDNNGNCVGCGKIFKQYTKFCGRCGAKA